MNCKILAVNTPLSIYARKKNMELMQIVISIEQMYSLQSRQIIQTIKTEKKSTGKVYKERDTQRETLK